MHSNSEKLFDVNIEPTREMYNTYFGGGMNDCIPGITRSKRFGIHCKSRPGCTFKTKISISNAHIHRTQNDKMNDALQAFNSILIDMPVSENAYELAKRVY